jgi:hypothetical protein
MTKSDALTAASCFKHNRASKQYVLLAKAGLSPEVEQADGSAYLESRVIVPPLPVQHLSSTAVG